MESTFPDFTGNIERWSGFADAYDQSRPHPPAMLAAVLTQHVQTPRPALVVDLGSGTGLSTRYWADKAEEVIGVEPTRDMRQQAEAQTTAPNVSYREGFSHQTGLPAQSAQIVTCSQALHWMEPQGTFAEAARILQPGGVFAAFDYDWPPTTGSWEADLAFETCIDRVHTLEKSHPPDHPVQRWKKEEHLGRMQASGCFRYTKEIVLHHTDSGHAARFTGLLLSQGSVMTLLKRGLSEEGIGLDTFRLTVHRALGDESRPWFWSSRVRVGMV